MKTRSVKHQSIAEESETSNFSPARQTRTSCKAYGETISICTNTDCMLRKKAGECLGFEGCPGFKSR